MAIDKTALYKLSYGLYAVTSNDGVRDNGLIVNLYNKADIYNDHTKTSRSIPK